MSRTWWAARPTPRVLHLDSAAMGRSALTTLEVVAAHARLEAEVGGYVAASDADGALRALRADLGTLLGVNPAGVALLGGAGAARDALLAAWPLPAGTRIGVVPAEWGPNLLAFRACGLVPTLLAVDGAGRVDLAALDRTLQHDPPGVVHLSHVAAHRGLVQPVTAALEVCRGHGVPLWVDAAQAVGHVDTRVGADATYATSRKWLTGPRGVGVLAVAAQHHDALRAPRPADAEELSAMRQLEPLEAHVAGRVGLGVAVREHLARHGEIEQGLAEVGRRTHEALADLPGWAAVGGPDGAITALRPLAGQDVVAVRSVLLQEHSILTTASLPWRAPGEMTGATLRLSPHVDCTDADLARAASALAAW